MVSKTKMLSLIKTFNWQEAQSGFEKTPDLIKYRDDKGRNFLHLCCATNIKNNQLKAKDSIKLAAFLLEQGCDPNHCLWAVAFKDDPASIKLLIRHKAEIDPVYESGGLTPFLSAVKGGHWAAAKELLNLGANVNFQDPKQRTALHWALKNGAPKQQVRLLLDHGARGDLKDEDGRNAAEIMKRKKDPELGKMAEQFFLAK